MKISTLQKGARAALVAGMSTTLLLGTVGTATAAKPADAGKGKAAAAADCAGRGVPLSKVSVQLFTFFLHIGFTGPVEAQQARHREVLAFLAETGYRNVEPYSLTGWTAEQYAAVLEEYGLKASSRHVDVGSPERPLSAAAIQQILAENKTLGITYFGSGSTPRTYTTAAQWQAYAEYLNRVGEQARKAGQTLMVHNHDWEFAPIAGSSRTGYDLLVAGTDKKNVSLQLDLYWVAFAGLDPETVVERLGNRVQLLHVKDLNRALANRIEIVGEGDLDFPGIFDEAGGSTKYYVVEHDPRFVPDPKDPFDPFEAAETGFEYLDCVDS